MQKAVMFSVPARHENGYVWRWRSIDSKHESSAAFGFYHDCLTDAREHGYEVELPVHQRLSRLTP
jgi:hypothetical protein